ncbi:fatty acid desaturase [Candidatus Sumerlaeota bacterium]|nr:fatty acid desaturase [Candidatus Sumerlaeota bacterium]
MGLALGLMWFASHTSSWISRVMAAMIFSYVNNTIFSLLHECVHGNFHANRTVNNWFGRLTAAFFPTAFTFQKICHLGHHRRNRTEAEIFDYYRPDDNKLIKYVQWYGILTGIYWTMSPLGCLLYLISPHIFRMRVLHASDSKLAHQTGTDAMLAGFEEAPETQVRLEILMTILIQALIIWGLGLSIAGWMCCYAAFAVNWSSLQYADHAWSELDVLEGAWNLKVNPLIRWVFLNYHHHLEHHRRPWVSWLHLPRYVDPEKPQPSFLSIYLKMWLGPRPLPEGIQPHTPPEVDQK